MGKPPTREIAGLVWTWKPDYETWTTETGLYVIRYDAPPGFPGGTDYFAPGPDEMFTRLADACEAEVRWHAEQDAKEATRAAPTLTPCELDQMLGDPPLALPATVAQEAEEREAQRRDTRAYYRNVAGWAFAALVLVALCSGVLRG